MNEREKVRRVNTAGYRVNGSAAYDYDYVREVDPKVSRGVAPRTRTAAAPAADRISPLNVLCVVIVMALLVVMINSYVMLSRSTQETVDLRNEISTLQDEEKVLRAQQTIDLAAIERYATEELGMVSLNSEKVVYVDVTGGDSAIVNEPGTSTMQTTGLFAMLVEYFR